VMSLGSVSAFLRRAFVLIQPEIVIAVVPTGEQKGVCESNLDSYQKLE
jgi:hypothetical protein